MTSVPTAQAKTSTPKASHLNSGDQLLHTLSTGTRPNSESVLHTFLFLSVLMAFFVGTLYFCATPTGLISNQENRMLSAPPQAPKSFKDLCEFIPRFEAFFNDRFALRMPLIATRNLLLYSTLRSSGHPTVLIGKNGWLYYGDPSTFYAQLNYQPFDESTLKNWADMIEARRNALADHNIRYLLVLAPEKGSIYPEFSPAGWTRSSGEGRIEQLQDYLRQHTNVDFVDARALLLANKVKEQLYYATDTHWNERGAFLVSQEILKHMSRYFTAVHPFPPTAYRTNYELLGGDLSRMLGLGNVLLEKCPTVEFGKLLSAQKIDGRCIPEIAGEQSAFAMQRADDTLPRMFVLRDSFGSSLWPFLAEYANFSEFHWTSRFILPIILAEKPDIVIDELAERHLWDHQPDHLPRFVPGANLAKDRLATFEDTLILQNLLMSEVSESANLKLCWRTSGRQRLDLQAVIQALDKRGKLLASCSCELDPFERFVPPNTGLQNAFHMPKQMLERAAQIGIIVTRKGGVPLLVKAQAVDCGSLRAVFSMEDIKTNCNRTDLSSTYLKLPVSTQ